MNSFCCNETSIPNVEEGSNCGGEDFFFFFYGDGGGFMANTAIGFNPGEVESTPLWEFEVDGILLAPILTWLT